MGEPGRLQQAGISHLGEGDIFFAAFPRLKAGISPQEEAGIYKAGHWHFIHCYHPVIQTRSLSQKGQLGLCCSLLLFFLFSPPPPRERGKNKAKPCTRTADCHFSCLESEGLLYHIKAKTFQSLSCEGVFCKALILLCFELQRCNPGPGARTVWVAPAFAPVLCWCSPLLW